MFKRNSKDPASFNPTQNTTPRNRGMFGICLPTLFIVRRRPSSREDLSMLLPAEEEPVVVTAANVPREVLLATFAYRALVTLLTSSAYPPAARGVFNGRGPRQTPSKLKELEHGVPVDKIISSNSRKERGLDHPLITFTRQVAALMEWAALAELVPNAFPHDVSYRKKWVRMGVPFIRKNVAKKFIEDKAIEEARKAGKEPDVFYALQLLDEIGIYSTILAIHDSPTILSPNSRP
ncbi:hypothetical protein ARMSODRAFT_975300 [Armillaria solidipes]|uniref:Uncharacterized protein n=1 Tax=Armillaria solidipes TaxID=1076256 RepID=A0A2H3BPV1_9AGAR|nr:hypothetical protein ARMSODRAFT_975300 [Armillaria solidipes]